MTATGNTKNTANPVASTEAVKQITYLAARAESTPDHRGRNPAGRPSPGRRLDP
jgi:hypothetical protein